MCAWLSITRGRRSGLLLFIDQDDITTTMTTTTTTMMMIMMMIVHIYALSSSRAPLPSENTTREMHFFRRFCPSISFFGTRGEKNKRIFLREKQFDTYIVIYFMRTGEKKQFSFRGDVLAFSDDDARPGHGVPSLFARSRSSIYYILYIVEARGTGAEHSSTPAFLPSHVFSIFIYQSLFL